jgi:hypothetical protein
MSVTVYPAQWPEGWPRTPYHQRQNDYRFRSSGYAFSGSSELTVARALKQLRHEFGTLGAGTVIVPINLVPERWAPTGALQQRVRRRPEVAIL